MPAAIWWIRRDLRLADNQALLCALERGFQVIPCYVLDPILMQANHAAPMRMNFLLGGLSMLNENLKKVGSRLVVRQGKPVEVLSSILQETGSQVIFAEQDFSPYAIQRDRQVGMLLPLELCGFPTAHHPEEVAKPDGRPPKVFTHFMRRWNLLPFPSASPLHSSGHSSLFSPTVFSVPSDTISAISKSGLTFPPGEEEAMTRLEAFSQGDEAPIYAYQEARNFLAESGTSGLSPYLRFGMVSARTAMLYARNAMNQAPHAQGKRSAETWLSELIWREFFMSVLYHFPDVLKDDFQPAMRYIPWRNNAEEFDAWCQGRTGYPLVDAAMRQLLNTGWMHNRARMVSASFLVKNLLIDWRWGEKWFLQHLVDGDPASNNGGWQWTAGTGTDAAPYFRVFNPISQSKKWDPDGKYIRRWVPELRKVPLEYIHSPAEMPDEVQRESDCKIGVDYPSPVVDFRESRERALQAFSFSRLVAKEKAQADTTANMPLSSSS